jgi:hypothetical protein
MLLRSAYGCTSANVTWLRGMVAVVEGSRTLCFVVALSQLLLQYLVGDYEIAGSALAVPLCSASKPIEEMHRGDVTSFCLAALQISYVSAAFQLASLHNWALAGVALLICADLG